MNERINTFKNFFQLQSQSITDPQIKEKLAVLLYREEVQGENRVIRINLAMTLMLFFGIVMVTISTRFSSMNAYMNISNFFGISLYFIYNITMFLILRKNIYKPFFKYLTVLANTLTPIIIALGYAFTGNSWLHALRTITLIGIFFPIILSGFYQRTDMVIYASFLVVIEYTSLVLYAILSNKIGLTTEETFNKPLYSIDLLVVYDLCFLFAGFLVAVICRHFNILLGRTLHTEADMYRVEKAKEEIELTSRIKTNFFINLSHETKTPLTLISNYMGKYIRQYGMNEDLKIIKQNIDKLQQDMVNFLDLEKLERGQVFYDNEQVFNISDLFSAKMPFFRTLAERKKIRFKSSIEESLFIQADPLAIDRIINNLLDNAVKFTNNEGLIEVMLISNDDEIIFKIKDNGIGISEEHKKNIFQPYYQISHAKRNIQGIGMGLYIVKKTLDSLSGRIFLESSTGAGSTFTVFLKKHMLTEKDKIKKDFEITAQSDNIPLNLTVSDSEVKEGYPCILIVEDNINMLQYLVDNLKSEYSIFPATDGTDALKKLENMPKPDFIISDIMMDGMDGYKFFEELMKIKEPDGRETYKETPFLFLTAMHSQEEKLKSLNRGAVDFISKPFLMEELKAKIKTFIELKEAQRDSDMNEFENKVARVIREKPDRKQEKTADVSNIIKKYNITIREKEIIDCIIAGMDNKDIAEKLFISANTVKRHIQNIYEKCQVENKIELFNLLKINK